MFKSIAARKTHQELPAADDADFQDQQRVAAQEEQHHQEQLASRLATVVGLEEDESGLGGDQHDDAAVTSLLLNGKDLPSTPYYGLLSAMRLEVPISLKEGDVLETMSARSLTGERGGKKFSAAVEKRCGHYQFGHELVPQLPGANNSLNQQSRRSNAAPARLPNVEVGKTVEALLGAYDALEKQWRSLRTAASKSSVTASGGGLGDTTIRGGKAAEGTTTTTPDVPQFHGFFYIVQQHPRHKTLSSSFFIEGNALSAFVASDSAKVRNDLSEALMGCGMASEWIDNALFVQHSLETMVYSAADGRVENPVSVVFDFVLNMDLVSSASSSGGDNHQHEEQPLRQQPIASTLPIGLMDPSTPVASRTTIMSTHSIPHGEWKPLQLRELDPVFITKAVGTNTTTAVPSAAIGIKRKDRDGEAPTSATEATTTTTFTKLCWATPTFPTSLILMPNAIQQLLLILTHEFKVKTFKLFMDANLTLVAANGLRVQPESATGGAKRLAGMKKRGVLGLGGAAANASDTKRSDGGVQFAEINRSLFVPFLCFSRLSSAEWATDSKPAVASTNNNEEGDDFAFEAEFYPSAISYDASARTMNKLTTMISRINRKRGGGGAVHPANNKLATAAVAFQQQRHPYFQLHSDVIRVLDFEEDEEGNRDDDDEVGGEKVAQGVAAAVEH